MPCVRTIAVINQKGGVGKTTTVANLGAAIASRGHDTCVIDLDPQSHLTLHLGVEPGTAPTSIYDVLHGQSPLASTAMLVAPHLWLVPSEIDLAAVEMELVSTVGRERILGDALKDQGAFCEYAMIDCPPSLGLLTLNALAAADELLIPLQPHFLALQGLGKLLETVGLVQQRINPALRVAGVLLCMHEPTTRLAVEVVQDLENFFAQARGGGTPWADAKIFQASIRRNVKLAESPSYGQTIFDYAPTAHGAEDYAGLADELLGMTRDAQRATQSGAEEADGRPTTMAPTADPDSSADQQRAPAASSSQCNSGAGANIPVLPAENATFHKDPTG